MQSYVESSRAAIQSLLASMKGSKVAIPRKGNAMAYLTMPLLDGELVAEETPWTLASTSGS